MVTCHVRYVLDPAKVGEFETFCRMWIPITNRMGGVHHGYLLPSEGANYADETKCFFSVERSFFRPVFEG